MKNNFFGTSVNVGRLWVALALVLMATPAAHATTPSLISQFGSSSYEEYPSVDTDNSGNIFIAGNSSGDFDGLVINSLCASRGFLRKMDKSGKLLWIVPFEAPGNSLYKNILSLHSVSVDKKTGDAYVSGHINQFIDGLDVNNCDIFTSKVSSSGQVLWTAQESSSNFKWESAYGTAVDSSGNVYVVGGTQGTMDGKTNPNIGTASVVIKYAPNGKRQWILEYPVFKPNTWYPTACNYGIVCYNNNVYVTGGYPQSGGNGFVYVYAVNSYGNVLWGSITNSGVAGRSITANASGIYVCGEAVNGFYTLKPIGYAPGYSSYNQDLFVVKFGFSGYKTWTKLYGTYSANDYANGIKVDSLNNIYITGTTGGSLNKQPSFGGVYDAYLLKLDNSGNVLSTCQVGTASNDCAHSVALDPMGNIVVAGTTEGCFPGQEKEGSLPDIFFMTFPSETGAAATVTVLEYGTNTPISGVSTIIKDLGGTQLYAATTGADGKISFKLPAAGTVMLYKNKAGYRSLVDPEDVIIRLGSNSIVSYMKKNTPPVAVIADPSSGNYAEGLALTFSGTAYDAEDGQMDGASVVWTSSIDGKIGTGTVFSTNGLSVGTHTIAMTVNDSDGASFTTSRAITIYALGETTASITVVDAKTGAPLNGVAVMIRDKKGALVQEATTNGDGLVVFTMNKAGMISIYSKKAGYRSAPNPVVAVVNRGAKNNILIKMQKGS